MNQPIVSIDHLRTFSGVELFVKRDDLIHPFVSGNKLYKLKFNVEDALKNGFNRILTFGGAYSNHIAATAAYCQQEGIQSIGIIRGEQTLPLNPTLAYATECNMRLEYIDRTAYRQKTDSDFLNELRHRFDQPYIIPEGGANLNGIKGAQEMLTDECAQFDVIALAMGTGTTFAGVVRGLLPHQRAVGFPIHKYGDIFDDVLNIDASLKSISKSNYHIEKEYHFGGYAKTNSELLSFMNETYRETGLKTDPIYTSKALFGLVDIIKKGVFKQGSKILFLHTGGLQGIAGFEERHGIKIFS